MSEEQAPYYVNMQEDSEFNLLFGWWRWLILPLACLLGFILTYTLGILLFMFFEWAWPIFTHLSFSDTWIFYAYPILINFFAGYIYIVILWKIAPFGRVIAGSVMTIILIMLGIIGGIKAIDNISYALFDHVVVILSLFALLVGCIYTIFRMFKNENEFL